MCHGRRHRQVFLCQGEKRASTRELVHDGVRPHQSGGRKAGSGTPTVCAVCLLQDQANQVISEFCQGVLELLVAQGVRYGGSTHKALP